MMIQIRHHVDEHPDRILAVWNEVLRLDPVDGGTFTRKVFLDANFRRGGLVLALDGESVVGFCLALARHVALEHQPAEDPSGYITAFALLPDYRRRGVGGRMFDAAESYLRCAGVARVRIAPYVPNYFVPGVDERAYPEAGAFLLGRGYARAGEGLAMDALLTETDPLAGLGDAAERVRAGGGEVRPLGAGLIPAFFEFLRESAPPDWSRHARQILMDGAPREDIIVAVRDGRVVGYCQFEGSHFGPFGVADSEQGKGIGTVLLARCLGRMKERGEHCAWVVWTGEKAAPLYERLGFRRTRVFTIFTKELTP
jgi:ribosomal protein S18 acetylase RimI-like enzyme